VPLEVKLDPRVKVSQSDLEQQLALLLQIRDELNFVNDTVNQIQDVRSQVSSLKRRLPENANAKVISASADDLDKKLTSLRDSLINLTISANEDSLAYAPQLDAQLAFLGIRVRSADAAPTESETRQFEKLKAQCADLQARWTELQQKDVAALQKLTEQSSLHTIMVPPAGQIPEQEHQPGTSAGGGQEQEY
jgi:hypothetical protein